jgi:hypothetical protein
LAKFSSNSRYVRFSHAYVSTGTDGQTVTAIAPANVPPQSVLGDHLLSEHERLDHLSHYYLGDATAFWRLCKMNDVLIPDAALSLRALRIPIRG